MDEALCTMEALEGLMVLPVMIPTKKSICFKKELLPMQPIMHRVSAGTQLKISMFADMYVRLITLTSPLPSTVAQ